MKPVRLVAVVAALAFALCLLGCGSKAPPGEPVQLLTGVRPFDEDECSNQGGYSFVLLVDPQYGTILEYVSDRLPVMWPPGYTGRRVGSEVVVVDPDGIAVATTGQSYNFSGQELLQTGTGEQTDYGRFSNGYVFSTIGVDMFYACGPAHPWPTLTPFPMI